LIAEKQRDRDAFVVGQRPGLSGEEATHSIG
jgi:hypothetical protein